MSDNQPPRHHHSFPLFLSTFSANADSHQTLLESPTKHLSTAPPPPPVPHPWSGSPVCCPYLGHQDGVCLQRAPLHLPSTGTRASCVLTALLIMSLTLLFPSPQGSSLAVVLCPSPASPPASSATNESHVPSTCLFLHPPVSSPFLSTLSTLFF